MLNRALVVFALMLIGCDAFAPSHVNKLGVGSVSRSAVSLRMGASQEQHMSRRAAVFGASVVAVSAPFSAIAANTTAAAPAAIKDCDEPAKPKPKGEEVCEVDY